MFINRYSLHHLGAYHKGDYCPELLFDEKEQPERLKTHPNGPFIFITRGNYWE